jgi:hypothetical protein
MTMDARRWPARGPWRFVGLAAILLLVGLVLWLGFRVVQPPPTVDWGPLAVVKTQEQPAARGPGTLRITETCVALIRPDGRGALLVWPADRVAWVAAEDAVRFRNLDGTVHVLRDGAAVVLQGGGDSVEPDALERRFDWVVLPDPACSFPEYFLVANVIPE